MIKYVNTLNLIESWLSTSVRPAMMCSFGKDSMVLLHFIKQNFGKLPVIFYKEPTMQRKYRFARQVIEDWNLQVHEYLPQRVGLQQVGDIVEFVNYYPIGQNLMTLALNRLEPTSDDCLCGVIDFLSKPTAVSSFPWDVVFHGHKSCDTDPSYDNLTLKQEVVKNEGCATIIFPLKDWTHEDVWRYIEENDVPIHLDRYEKVEGAWQNKEDKTYNPDFFPICTKCLLSTDRVKCPKFKQEVAGLRNSIEITKPFIPSYVETK